MKILKKILVFILALVLTGLIGGLLLSFAIKNVIQEELVGGFVKENFVPIVTQNSILNEEEQEQLKTILEDEEFDKVINNMVDELLITMGSGDVEFSQETIDSIFDYVIENKDKLESITGQEINVEELETLKNSDEYKAMSEGLTEALNESSNDLDDSTKSVIKTYTYMVSDQFRLILVGCIIIDILLIALLQWSLYNWISTFGKSLTTSGITLLFLYFFMNAIIKSLMNELNMTLNIDTSSVLTMGIVSIVIGTLLVIVRKIINKIILNKKSENQEIEYNAVS